MKNILENVKIIIFVVNKSIKYLLFRVYNTEQLMIKAATAMAADRMERSELGQKFLIPRPVENSWGRIELSARRELSGNSLSSPLL